MNISNKPVYTSGVASSILGINNKTLINYENAKLISIKRNAKGRRLYSQQDLYNILLIRYLMKEKGLTMKGIKLAKKLVNAAKKKGADIFNLLVPPKIEQKLLKKVI
ncbi:MerR family transcriptional regulator [Candidatus Dojkabacteria bacterium]|nr:MerR family transcriptional regulator [Candidatus Dojkabacteria bacterium]